MEVMATAREEDRNTDRQPEAYEPLEVMATASREGGRYTDHHPEIGAYAEVMVTDSREGAQKH